MIPPENRKLGLEHEYVRGCTLGARKRAFWGNGDHEMNRTIKTPRYKFLPPIVSSPFQSPSERCRDGAPSQVLNMRNKAENLSKNRRG